MRIFDRTYSVVGFILRLIGVLIVLALLIWAIASFIGLFTDDASAPSPNKTGSSSQAESGTSSSQSGQSTSTSSSGSSSSSNNNTAQSGQSETSSSSGSSKTTSGGHVSSTSTNIPNSGPGDVFAIFLLATAAGYIGYQVSLRKRFQN